MSQSPHNRFNPGRSLAIPRGDYVSPGLKVILPDECFPQMTIGDPSAHPWAFMRKNIPHNWYIDRRNTTIGFLSRDEASILYNSALQFRGRNALEIGCYVGWSACHIALAGVHLDIIDPILSSPKVHHTVTESLRAAGVLASVRLMADKSPGKVVDLATRENRKWSFIFIDGDHNNFAPLLDAVVADEAAEDNAMILFHDLTSPFVSRGLDYLKGRGWSTRIYQTMQIMGAAWRGDAHPVDHIPDPTISWDTPVHLQRYVE